MFDPTSRQWLQTPEPFQPLRPTVRSVLASNPRGLIGGLLLGAVVLLVALGALVIA